MKEILLAEDDEDLALLLKLKLENSGYSVTLAEDGLKALDCLKENDFPVLVTDLQMPKMDGFELVNKLIQNDEHPVIIVLSSLDSPETISNLESLGIFKYLLKPICFEALEQNLGEAFDFLETN